VNKTILVMVALLAVAIPVMAADDKEIAGFLKIGEFGVPTETPVKGSCYIYRHLEVDGTSYLDGNVDVDGVATFNTTDTHHANVVMDGNDFSFSAATGSVSATITGSFGSTSYTVYLEPTANVTPAGIANKTATSFDVLYQSASTTTVQGHVFCR